MDESRPRKPRNAEELRGQLESIKKRQLALRSQIPPSGKVEHAELPRQSASGPQDARMGPPHPKNRMSSTLRSSNASALSKRSTQKLNFSAGTQSTQLTTRPASASSVGLRLSQPRPAKSRLRTSQEWVPAGALFQAPPSISWHRTSLRPQSAKHLRSIVSAVEGSKGGEEVVTRVGSPAINRRLDPRDQASVSWAVEGGDVQLHDGMGKMTLVGPAKVRYKALLSGGHLVRFLFRLPPPSSELSAAVSLSSGHSGWRLFRRLALQVSAGGRASLLYNVGPAARRDADHVVPLGALTVGEWHVCQLLVGSTGEARAQVDVWSVPGRSDPNDLPQVGRGLHGCRRLYWHHFVLAGAAEGEDGGVGEQAGQQTREWDLAVETMSGGLEVGAWRIVPAHRQPTALPPPVQAQSAGARRQSVVADGHKPDVGRADPLGDVGLAGELDAESIAQTWDVQKVLRFLETFKDEFGEALTRHYADIFQANAIDGAALLAVTAADLEAIGVRESGHRLLILKEVEGHLLACGSRALARRGPPGSGMAAPVEPHAPPSRTEEEPLRALLESLRNELGDDKMREYKVLLSAAGVKTVQDVIALTDAQLLHAGVRALSHRKLLLARAETLKLLAVPGVFDKAEQGSAEFGADRNGRADIHPVVPHGFQTQAGPGLATVAIGSAEFGEAARVLLSWAGELDGTTVAVEGVHRVVLTSRLLERFKRRRAALRNPYAPVLRLIHAGTGPQSLPDACVHGVQPPYKAGEFGKGMDFVGALRPSCQAPWGFPPGRHQLLVCDVAVGISWRMPDHVRQAVGEWDEDAAGIGFDHLHDWAVSSAGCDELGGPGWFKLRSGGFAECRQELRAGDTLCFSFRYKEPVLAAEAGHGRSLWASGFVQRGVYGSEAYNRFGFAVTSGGEVVLVHEQASGDDDRGGGKGRDGGNLNAKGSSGKRAKCVRIGQVAERVWYACEIRIGAEEEAVAGLELFAGRSDGAAMEELGGGGARGGERSLCSHQSALRGRGGQAWTAAVQLEGAGELELDDWLARHTVERSGVDDEEEGGGAVGSVALDSVRRAGYDSVYVPREVEFVDAGKLKVEEQLRNKVGKALELAKAAQKQRAEETLAGKKPNADDKTATKPRGEKVVKAAGHRRGGARMGCRCEQCALQLAEGADKVSLWKQAGGSAQKETEESKLAPTPFSLEHYDQYVVYAPDQALPRYVISFTVKEKPPPPPPEVPPCWLCSDPPYRVQLSNTTILLHMTGKEVPVCFNCAAQSRVPDAPIFLAAADDGDPAAVATRGVATAWTRPFAPAPIDMYLLQHALREEGDEELPPDGAFREVFSGTETKFAVRGLGPGQHCFRVRAKSMAGWGPWSEVLVRRVRRAARGGAGGSGAKEGGESGRVLCDVDPWWSRKSTAPVVFSELPHPAAVDPPAPAAPEGEETSGDGDGRALGGWEGPVGTISAERRVQYCCAWHPVAEELWVKENAGSLEASVLGRRGQWLRAVRLPVPAMCMSFGPDGTLYTGSGGSTFSRISPDMVEEWRAEHSDGPCARGIAVDGAVVYAAFNCGPVLELDAASGARLRVIRVEPAFNMALSLAVVRPGVCAVSDSGRVLLYSVATGALLTTVATGYLNAAMAWDGRKLLVANANDSVWHMFRPTHR